MAYFVVRLRSHRFGMRRRSRGWHLRALPRRVFRHQQALESGSFAAALQKALLTIRTRTSLSYRRFARKFLELTHGSNSHMFLGIMKKFFSILIGTSCTLSSLTAANFNPVAVTGYNFDAVVENNASIFSNVARSLDATGNVFYEVGLPESTGGSGLPIAEQVSASVGGNNFSFNLASYGNNAGLVSNTLQIAPGDGNHAFISLGLNTPSNYTAMAFLGFSTEAQPATAVGDIQLTFSDNSTSLYSGALNIPDWYFGNGTISHPLIYNSTGRVNINDGLFNQNLSGVGANDGGKLFASVITLTDNDKNKLVQSVGFRITSSTSADRTYIMGVSAVPEPGTVSLIALTAAAMAIRRRRSHGSR